MTLPHPIDAPVINLFEKGILFVRFVTGLKHSTVVKFLKSAGLAFMFTSDVCDKAYFWAFIWSAWLLLTQFDPTLDMQESTAERSQMPVRSDGKDNMWVCTIRVFLMITGVLLLPHSFQHHRYVLVTQHCTILALLYLEACDIYPSSGITLRSWINSRLASRPHAQALLCPIRPH